ncbi:MAG: Rrf2 family transcriptional regulator [Candidatus Sabulitectum sp.]|nr:Rrf2 family transcriptional regulator [Candidatus Sabulitectum sp.]
MARLLKISEAASIAMHALILLAEKQGEQLSNRRIAEAFNISANHSSKVLQRLIKGGFVNAVRGPGGGYSLAVDPEEVSLLDVYKAVDGEPDCGNCLFGRGKHCSLDTCLFSEMISDAEKLIQKHLGSVTLAYYMDRDIGLPVKGIEK